MSRKEPLIIVISAPSGSGKTTLITRLMEEVPNLRRSISYTTRAPRPDESNNEDYVFIKEEEFKTKIEKDEFLEWEENFGNYYGTSREQFDDAIETKSAIILSIDIKGAKTVKERFPECVGIFIMPPSKEELEARLKKRDTEHKDQMSIRLKEAEKEIEASEEYDYLIINENFEEALKELRSIVETEREKRKV